MDPSSRCEHLRFLVAYYRGHLFPGQLLKFGDPGRTVWNLEARGSYCVAMTRICLFYFICVAGMLSCNAQAGAEDRPMIDPGTEVAKANSLARRNAYVREARDFVSKKNARLDLFLLYDLSLHSGKKRLFLIDLSTGYAIDSFMVSHGAGRNPWGRDLSKASPATSNTVNSHLSSEGRYLVGNRDYSSWGIHVKYWMYGQDPTNCNAVKRVVVLHSWDYTPDEEVYPDGTPESWGCPAVSNITMKKLDELLSSSNQKMLLWIVK